MHSPLLAETYELLDVCSLSLREIADGSGVNYHWLGKFKQRKFDNPGIRTVEHLRAFLLGERATPVGPPPAEADVRA